MDNPEFLRLLEEFGHDWFRSADNRRFDLAVAYLISANDLGRGVDRHFPNDESELETAIPSLVSTEK
jgi:hypothetical protein